MSATVVTMRAAVGEFVDDAARRAIDVARKAGVVVKLIHNDRTAHVERDSSIAGVAAQFQRQDRTRVADHLEGVIRTVVADLEVVLRNAEGSGNHIDGVSVVKVPAVRNAVSWLQLVIEEAS